MLYSLIHAYINKSMIGPIDVIPRVLFITLNRTVAVTAMVIFRHDFSDIFFNFNFI